MKRLIAMLLTLAVLLTVMLIPAAHAENYATAVVKGGWLRLRGGASTDAETISAYFTGTTVTVLGASGQWYRVLTPDGKTGYMHSNFLTLTGLSSGSTLEENTTGVVKSTNGKAVRLRSGPSVQYSIIATYAVGTPLTVLSTSGDWCKVRVNGRTGYMMKEFINISGTVSGGYTAYVVSANGKSVVLRSGPSKQNTALASYSVGQQVTVLSYGSTWSQVRINGLDGYMMSEFLSTVKPEGTISTGSSSYTAYVTSKNGKSVRLRSGAGKLFPTLASYSVGTQVTVLEAGSEWSRVRIGTNTGYMMSEFLTTTAPGKITSASISATSVRPGELLAVTVLPSTASVSVNWVNDLGQTVGNGTTYTATTADVGRKIRASVTGTGSSSGTAVTAWATVVSGYVAQVYQLKTVTISDTTPTVGQTLSATLSPAGATATISWFRDNGVFAGSGSNYIVSAADAGYKLYACADGTGLTTGSVTSAYTSVVVAATSPTIALQSVTISDTTPVVGDVLRATVTPANATASFTWRSSSGNILGYGDQYTVTADVVGSSLYVYANGTGSTSGSVVSKLTTAVQPQTAATVRVDGVTISSTEPVVGQRLYVTLNPQSASATYTWYRDDDKILSTTDSYIVQAEDVGHSLYVWAEGANGTFGSATSKITAPVKAN